MEDFELTVSSDGGTVWVNAFDGSSIARFSKRFGIDIHRSATEQLAGAGQCLYCTHEKALESDWLLFCDKVAELHNIRIPKDSITF